MVHPLVTQLRFTRSEWVRGLKDVSAEDALRRLELMNCISWMVGHLAHQEQTYWVRMAQDRIVVPELDKVAWGQPASTPPLDAMWAAWEAVTSAADLYLDTLTTDRLQTYLLRDGKPARENVGTLLMRNIYHYWYHLGEGLAVRQMLGHGDLPQFVGDISRASYRPE